MLFCDDYWCRAVGAGLVRELQLPLFLTHELEKLMPKAESQYSVNGSKYTEFKFSL